jgi:hypothetical protein
VRKLLTLFLLLIVLMQVMGYYIVFRLRQLELQTEVKIYLRSHANDRHLTYFEFDTRNGQVVNEQFQWAEKNEFQFAGKMYDVINLHVQGGKMLLSCLEDKKETELIKSFGASQQQQSRTGKNTSTSLLQFFANLYVITELEYITATPPEASSLYSEYQFLLANRNHEILTPPPQNC